MQSVLKTKEKKFVPAPPPTDSYLMPSIFGIYLTEEETVEWHWLELPDGNRVVVDYTICIRPRDSR